MNINTKRLGNVPNPKIPHRGYIFTVQRFGSVSLESKDWVSLSQLGSFDCVIGARRFSIYTEDLSGIGRVKNPIGLDYHFTW